MKKKQTILFDIPSPCHEDWNQMSIQDQGRHCALCNKIVVDFSSLSDDEVLNYLRKSSGKICGRIPISNIEQTPRWQYVTYAKVFLYAFAVIFFLGISEVSEAQVNKQSSDSSYVLSNSSLKGRVVDEKGKPLDFAVIRIFCDGVQIAGVKSNLDGRFYIKNLKSGKYHVIINYVGYEMHESKTILLNGVSNVELKIKMKLGHSKRMGEIVFRYYKNKLIDPSNPGQKILDQSQIKHSAY